MYMHVLVNARNMERLLHYAMRRKKDLVVDPLQRIFDLMSGTRSRIEIVCLDSLQTNNLSGNNLIRKSAVH